MKDFHIRLGNASVGLPGSDWTGFYAGGHLGYALGSTSGVTTTANGMSGGIAKTESANVDFRDLTRGIQGGFNYQFSNRMVIGVEGDFSWTKLRKMQNAVSTESAQIAAGSFLQAKTDYKIDWTASLRGRVGYAFDRMLVYATGGLAFLNETETRTQYQQPSANNLWTQVSFNEQSSVVRSGWTLGTGFEYAMNNNWSLKGEYTYDHFGNADFLFPNATAGVMAQTTQRVCLIYYPNGSCRIFTNRPVAGSSQTTNGRLAKNELDLHAVKLGVNYRF